MSEWKKSEIDLYIIEVVKKMRNQKKMSQAELGFHLGVTGTFVGLVENPNSRAKYNVYHLYRLRKIFNCSYDDFFPAENPVVKSNH